MTVKLETTMKTIGPALVGWVLFFTTPVRADSYNYTFYPGANLDDGLGECADVGVAPIELPVKMRP